MTNPVSETTVASITLLSPNVPSVVSKTQELEQPSGSAAAVALPVIQQAGAAKEVKAPSDLPTVTKTAAPTAEKTAEKTAVAAEVAKPVAVSSSESMAEKVCVSAGIACSEGIPGKAGDEKKAEEKKTPLVEGMKHAPIPEKDQPAYAAHLQRVFGLDSVDATEMAAGRPRITREQKENLFVEKRKKDILGLFNEWKKDLDPHPSFLLSFVPGSSSKAKEDGEKMVATFERKLGAAANILGLKEVLDKNIEAMTKRLNLVDQTTYDKLQKAIDMCKAQIALLPLKKTAPKTQTP